MTSALHSFGSNLWTYEGPSLKSFGFEFPTRMAVIRLRDGALFIWSPVELTNDLRTEVEALGPATYLIAPNHLHHLFLAGWQKAFPGAKLWAPPGLREKRPDLRFHGDFDTPSKNPWADEIELVVVQGNRITQEVVFFHKESQTVLFCDLLQNFPRGWFSGWRSVIARLDLLTSPTPIVPRKFRVSFTNRAQGRAALQRIQSWPAERVLMAHGTPIETDGQRFLQNAFDWLIKSPPL